MLEVYNSLARKIGEFRPRKEGEVKLYTCGPTVYARPHIGNYRTYIFEDTVKRLLLSKGYKVTHAMNITDFDNTILREARKSGTAWREMTKKYEGIFLREMQLLGTLPADFYPHASKYAEKMAESAARLIRKGNAYRDEEGQVFFDISKFGSYGLLAGRMISNERKVTKEDYKLFEAGDFLLFQPCQKESGNCFHTSMGQGHPQWNIQCAAMSVDCLGEQIDISMGGKDNRFNHHENTRAIAESLSGKEYSKYWIHVKHLIYDGKKMSKSKGNVVKLPDLLARGFSPKAVRMLLLSVGYRRRLNFTWEYADEIRERFAGMEKGIARIREADGEEAGLMLDRMLKHAEEEFGKAMDNDFDIPEALAIGERLIFDCDGLAIRSTLAAKDAEKAMALLKKFDYVLACIPI